MSLLRLRNMNCLHYSSLVNLLSQDRRLWLALLVCAMGCLHSNRLIIAQETAAHSSLVETQGELASVERSWAWNDASDARHSMDTYERQSQSPVFGFANGFVLASPNMNSFTRRDYPFSTRLTGWMQLRHAIFESDGPNRDRNAFSLERIRVGVDGHAYSPDLQYTLILDANSDQAVQVSFLDAFVNYDFGRNLFNLDAGRFGFRLGKWKSPFSRSREESARRFQFTERSVANLFFDIGRATGVSLYGGNNLFSVPSHFEIALINGINTGRDAAVSADDLDQNFGWSARTSLDPLGAFDDGESDLAWS